MFLILTVFSMSKDRVQLLTASKEVIEATNPLLEEGEVLFEEVYGPDGKLKERRSKVGDGKTLYNNLKYHAGDIYEDTTPVSQDIGDWKAGDVLYGMRAIDIIKGIVSKYVKPAISSITHNISGIHKNSHVYEIGKAISGSFTLAFTKTNNENIEDTSSARLSTTVPIFSAGFEVFNLKQASSLNLTVGNPYRPQNITTLSLGVSFKDKKGEIISSPVANILWHARIYSGSSTLSKLTTEAQIKGLANNLLADNRARNYAFAGNGYSYVCIPEQIVRTGITFTDPATNLTYPMALQNIDDPSAPTTITITNAEGIKVTYYIYRSVNYLSAVSTLKVS